jgi:hypothetical protein
MAVQTATVTGTASALQQELAKDYCDTIGQSDAQSKEQRRNAFKLNHQLRAFDGPLAVYRMSDVAQYSVLPG